MKLVDDPPGLFRDSIPLTCKEGGVYAIVNRNSSRMYIGGTRNFSGRRAMHKLQFRQRKHADKELQKDVLASPKDFEFVIIESVADKNKILDREQFWLDFFQSYLPENGYNRCRSSKSMLGFKHDESFRQAVSKRFSGKKLPPRTSEWSAKISASLKGKKAHNRRSVIQMDASGKEIKKFDCLTEASVAFGMKPTSTAILSSIKRGQMSKGFKWKYA